MLVKVCNTCRNRYTKDLSLETCPFCHSALSVKSVGEGDLIGWEEFFGAGSGGNLPPAWGPAPAPVPTGGTNPAVPPIPGPPTPVMTQPTNVVPPANNAVQAPQMQGNGRIRGRVMQYSNTGREDGNYRRLLLIQKIPEALIYHQRLEDLLHRFNVRVDPGDRMGYAQYVDVPVNVHGTISGGMQLADNAEVEVEGKFRGGTLMARRIYVITNGGRSQVKFQRAVGLIVTGILALLALIGVIVFASTVDGGFAANLKYLCIAWGITFAVSSVLYLLLILSRLGLVARIVGGQRPRFPFVGILLFSLMVAMIITYNFGPGAALSLGATVGGFFSSLLSAAIPIIVLIVIVLILLKLLF